MKKQIKDMGYTLEDMKEIFYRGILITDMPEDDEAELLFTVALKTIQELRDEKPLFTQEEVQKLIDKLGKYLEDPAKAEKRWLEQKKF